ncbi:MAG TPA: hypothetical protein VJ739_19075 [Gemmataceae bacterium]|nr:hypothetical protein [Gemmataceae bacterium]
MMKSAWSLPLAFVMFGALTTGAPAQEKEVTLKGTILCARCALKETKTCTTAIIVQEGGKKVTYYFKDKGNKEGYHEEVCGGDRKQGTVTGTVFEKDRKKWITPKKVEYKKADAKLNELHKERLATLRALADQTTKDYKAGRVAFDRVHQATRAVLHAELELCESDKERFSVLEKLVAQAKANEQHAAERYKSGAAPSSDALIATADRLEAEIALARAKSTVATPLDRGEKRPAPQAAGCCGAPAKKAQPRCCCCGR